MATDPKDRAAEVKEEFGRSAQVVPKYKPNRKQKRTQEAVAKRVAKEKARGK